MLDLEIVFMVHIGHINGSFQQVFQFTDIARPGIVCSNSRAGSEIPRTDVFKCWLILAIKVCGDQRYIIQSFAQRGNISLTTFKR